MFRGGGYQGGKQARERKKAEKSPRAWEDYVEKNTVSTTYSSGETVPGPASPDYVPPAPGPLSADGTHVLPRGAARKPKPQQILDALFDDLELDPFQAYLAPMVLRESQRTGVPASVLMAQLGQESGWGANTGPSSANAQGVSQFIPSTAETYGVPFEDLPPEGSVKGDPRKVTEEQVRGQADLMAELLSSADGDVGRALKGYVSGDIDSTYTESTDYMNSILAAAREWSPMDKAAGSKAAFKAPDSPLAFEGGPQDVRTAIDVVPKHKLFKWLQGAGGSTGNRDNIANLNPVFARHLIRAAAKSGDPLTITSGQRMEEEQAAIDPGTNPAAPPGYSVHQFGGAVDSEPTAEQVRLLEEEGIEHGYAGGEPDPPHTEFTDPRLIKRMTDFGPVRSGYAPAGLEEAVGDITSWSGDGTSSGGAVAPSTSTGLVSGMTPSSSDLMTAAMEPSEPAPSDDTDLGQIMGLLEAPLPSVRDPLQPLKRRQDDLLKLALGGRL